MLISADIWPLLQSCPEPVVAYVAQLLEDKEQLEQENARLRVQINQNWVTVMCPHPKIYSRRISACEKRAGSQADSLDIRRHPADRRIR